jgi:hypothetical protein
MDASAGGIESQAELQVMTDLVHNVHKSEETEESIAFATKEIAKYAKKMDFIIMGILISLLLIVGVRLLLIFIKNKAMVLGIDKSGATQWPTSGLGTAIAYEIPALAGLMGFSDKFLAIAAWMCYNFYADNPYFKKYPGNCLDLMAMQSKFGAKGVAGGSLSAMSLICGPQSWGASCINPPLKHCAGQCPGGAIPDVSTIVGAGVSGATNGAFIGGENPVAVGIAAAMMGGLQIGQSFLSHHDSNQSTRDANNCAK